MKLLTSIAIAALLGSTDAVTMTTVQKVQTHENKKTRLCKHNGNELPPRDDRRKLKKAMRQRYRTIRKMNAVEFMKACGHHVEDKMTRDDMIKCLAGDQPVGGFLCPAMRATKWWDKKHFDDEAREGSLDVYEINDYVIKKKARLPRDQLQKLIDEAKGGDSGNDSGDDNNNGSGEDNNNGGGQDNNNGGGEDNNNGGGEDNNNGGGEDNNNGGGEDNNNGGGEDNNNGGGEDNNNGGGEDNNNGSGDDNSNSGPTDPLNYKTNYNDYVYTAYTWPTEYMTACGGMDISKEKYLANNDPAKTGTTHSCRSIIDALWEG